MDQGQVGGVGGRTKNKHTASSMPELDYGFDCDLTTWPESGGDMHTNTLAELC